ncbi:MAG: hypothetical protein JW913_08535 [Chitinispirillaceae bacterium]|nr:hypothetical protein [Chitinispirillaceae bacterium]
MAITLISLILLIILVLIAIKTGLNRDRLIDEPVEKPTIHTSGIYSIVRESPRRNILAYKPPKEDILQYIDGLNVDMKGSPLSATEKSGIVDRWYRSIEENITAIEKGDLEGIEFYYYEFLPVDCPVCMRHFSRGKFVTREEIFRYPSIMPPLHLGCTCKILPHHGKENLRETTELGMLPLFRNKVPPPLPHWKFIIKPEPV